MVELKDQRGLNGWTILRHPQHRFSDWKIALDIWSRYWNLIKLLFCYRGGFPGSQPVSLDRDRIRLLQEKPYKVSWYAFCPIWLESPLSWCIYFKSNWPSLLATKLFCFLTGKPTELDTWCSSPAKIRQQFYEVFFNCFRLWWTQKARIFFGSTEKWLSFVKRSRSSL